jgi:hypothetical protein
MGAKAILRAQESAPEKQKPDHQRIDIFLLGKDLLNFYVFMEKFLCIYLVVIMDILSTFTAIFESSGVFDLG